MNKIITKFQCSFTFDLHQFTQKKALVKILDAIVFLQYSKRNERNDKGEPDPSKNPPYLHEYSNFYIKIVPSLDFSIP